MAEPNTQPEAQPAQPAGDDLPHLFAPTEGEQELDAVLSGQADPSTLLHPDSQTKPEDGSDATKGGDQIPEPQKKAEQEAKTEQTSDADSDAGPSAEDLAKALSFSETPDQKITRLEQQYSASSREGKFLDSVLGKVRTMLGSQGKELLVDRKTGDVKILLAKGQDGSPAQDVKIQYDKLTDDEQSLFDDSPQKFVDLIVSRAVSSVVPKIEPTDERPAPDLSESDRDAAVDYLASLKGLDGEPKHPRLKDNLPLINQMLDDPSATSALREFFNKAPTVALELLDLRIEATRAAMSRLARNQKDTQEAKQKASETSPEYGGGRGANSATQRAKLDPSRDPEAIAEAIANADGF